MESKPHCALVRTILVNSRHDHDYPILSLYLIKRSGRCWQHEIGIWAGFIFAANFLTSFLFQPLWGKLSDKYGRKVMLLRSGFRMAIVIALMGLAQNPWQLLLLRLLTVLSPVSILQLLLISGTTPKDRMGFAMGISQSRAGCRHNPGSTHWWFVSGCGRLPPHFPLQVD
ncbi:MFS transporter [Paenibacillus amylolyticus]|nr:MFS transporter [Paenibacillus amylolyticus]